MLQLLLTFLDPKTTVLSRELVNSILQCCFQMFETKSNAVKSTIQATLKTLMTLMTDTFTIECKKAGIPSHTTALDKQKPLTSDEATFVK